MADSSEEPSEREEEQPKPRRGLSRSDSTHLDDHIVGARPARMQMDSSVLPMLKDSEDVELTNVEMSAAQVMVEVATRSVAGIDILQCCILDSTTVIMCRLVCGHQKGLSVLGEVA